MNPIGNAQPKRTMGSYTAPTLDFSECSIGIPPIGVNHFELNPELIFLVQQNFQFHGLPQEDPNKFISDFLQIYWVKLDIFYYELSDIARMSLDNSAGGSLHMNKTTEEAYELIEMDTNNQYLYSSGETSMKGEVKTVSTESDPPEQSESLTQQLHSLTQKLLSLQEVLQETRASNKNIEARLNQAK
ncbi:hypothetical protein AHAS_Ahas14G0102400 [Arachis hypogaea]